MLSQTQQKIKILKSLFFGITYVLFFQANLIAQTTLGTISGTGSTGCSLTFNVNEGSIIRLTPTDEVGYSDFAWYYDQISQANIINSAAIAAGQFNIDSASVLPALLVKAPFGAAQSLRYILTSNVARTGCQAKPDTIHLNIIPIPPVANPDNAFAISGTQLNIPILINDLNPDGKPVVDLSKITKPGITLSPKKGTATINQNGSLSYTPDATATGRDTLIYEICNVFDITKCDTAVVIIDITPSNGPPIAIDDFKNTNEDTPVSGSVAGNDYDLTGNIDTLSFSIFKGPSKGSIVMGPNGSYTYIPAPDFSGKDTICYKVCDTGFPVFCDSAKLVINVEPVNDPPVAVYNTVTTPEDVPVTFSVTGNDFDIDGNINPSSVVVTVPPAHGTVSVDPITGVVTYIPAPNYNGPDVLIYRVCDDGTPLPALCDTAIVYINVTPVADLPLANADFSSTNEDSPVNIAVLINDTFGNDGPSVGAIRITDAANHGTATVNTNGTPNDPTDDSIDYIPLQNYNGRDTLVYEICDASGDCDTAVVFINILPVNDPPVAVYNTVNTPEDVPVTFSVLDNDYDIDGNINPSSVVVTVPPAHGTVSVDPITGVVTYIPAPNYNGPDVLIYRVCDDGTPLPALCDTAIVYINVTPVISVNFKNYVWLDSNQNGVQDANEPPIPGVGFELYSLSNPAQVIAVTSSDASGLYIFSSIAPGSYFIRTITSTFPQGAFITTPDLTTDNKDSDFNQASFTTGVITVAAVKSIANYNNLADLGLFLPRPSFKKFCGSVRVKILK